MSSTLILFGLLPLVAFVVIDAWSGLRAGIIAAVVHSGHLAAREFDAEDPGEVPFLRERVKL